MNLHRIVDKLANNFFLTKNKLYLFIEIDRVQRYNA